ncbi:nitrate reductase delta subunit [Kineosphaera limosa]|uniref:Nitrate reductase delta subunit n=1 Tax=Kineosphaera limosa NBRC 100340 TaxID=1184609 RepID=K6XFV3_9MICO|nr:nitrate reductase molybdenum cofactor assembly chaperone [Kineosphaera limosa]NYE01576.1 nitrate reductase delta subunit [Kineosphaera limosa]GAB97719.1 nitrate reductase delta subunit [Kineosphaera limosa NBRC 100340]
MRIPLTLLRRPPKPAQPLRDPGYSGEPGAIGSRGPARAPAHERTAGVRVDEATRQLYQVLSLVLDYPGPQLRERLPLLVEVVQELSRGRGAVARSAAALSPLLEHLAATPAEELERAYVETFDLRRRCCLHLSYYGYGDTRKRGMALLDIKQAYQASGVDLEDDELPDHLCVLLEFTATVDPPVGRVLLLDHRPGIELLRISLADRHSPYLAAVEALTGTFPTMVGSDRDAVAALIANGPPDEEVGMEAYQSGSYADESVRS